MEAKDDVQIDTNLYSRQIGTFGIETMGKLVKMNTVIVGLRGVGVEIAKNLILAGPASVAICDPTIVKVEDLGAQFYCEEKHIGKVSRAEACIQNLSELNPHVKVHVLPAEELESHISGGKANVVCQSELFLGDKFINPSSLNATCRKGNAGFIHCGTFGAFGTAFLDFGEKHVVTDGNGEA